MSKPNYILDHIAASDANVAVGHTFSLGALFGILFHMLPAVAALAPLVFYCLMIWESKTVQKWRREHRHKRRVKRQWKAYHEHRRTVRPRETSR
jgi:hypothetical protein